MRIGIALAVVILAGACTARAPEAATTAAPSVSSSETAEPYHTTEPSLAPFPSPSPTPVEQPVQVPAIDLAVEGAAFPIEATLALRPAPVNDEATSIVRWGVERYLEMLDHFRATGATNREALSVYGRFGDAVFNGIKASKDVERKFAVGSLRIDRYLVKPWGTRALAEVTVTILDKAVDGSLPDQAETGRLRLTGDKMFVTDAWDYASGGWFNGTKGKSDAEVREGLTWAIPPHLGLETWVPGSAPVNWGDESTPFWRAWHAYLLSLDRSATTSRTFENVTARIERYETFADIPDGLATVHVRGTIVTTDAGGKSARKPFERTMRVFFGNWIPEVVDEQITPGVWLSGGDLALGARDVNTA